jgi:hypothetical protein
MLKTNSTKPDSILTDAALDSHRSAWTRRIAGIIVAILLVLLVVVAIVEVVLATLIPDVRQVYVRDIRDSGKEPAFLLTLAFLITFGVVRLITYSIHTQRLGLFRDAKTKGGLHIHHLVPGMLLVLFSGYLSLVLPVHRLAQVLAIVFGIGAALVLDEFALWFRLADVYWEPQGRDSIDAVMLAGGVCLLYLLGLDFWPDLIKAVLGSVPMHL